MSTTSKLVPKNLPCLGKCGPDGLGRPVLDVPGGGLEVRRASTVVLVDIAVVVAAVVLDYRGGHGEAAAVAGRAGGEGVGFIVRCGFRGNVIEAEKRAPEQKVLPGAKTGAKKSAPGST